MVEITRRAIYHLSHASFLQRLPLVPSFSRPEERKDSMVARKRKRKFVSVGNAFSNSLRSGSHCPLNIWPQTPLQSGSDQTQTGLEMISEEEPKVIRTHRKSAHHWIAIICTIGPFHALELIGPLLCERNRKEARERKRSINYATQITIRLGTLIESERYPYEEC